MKSQVLFYGNLQKAQTVLGCVQASIVGGADILKRKGVRSDTYTLIERHVAELEEIERDLVALINAAIEDSARIIDGGNGFVARQPTDGDVQ